MIFSFKYLNRRNRKWVNWIFRIYIPILWKNRFNIDNLFAISIQHFIQFLIQFGIFSFEWISFDLQFFLLTNKYFQIIVQLRNLNSKPNHDQKRPKESILSLVHWLVPIVLPKHSVPHCPIRCARKWKNRFEQFDCYSHELDVVLDGRSTIDEWSSSLANMRILLTIKSPLTSFNSRVNSSNLFCKTSFSSWTFFKAVFNRWTVD